MLSLLSVSPFKSQAGRRRGLRLLAIAVLRTDYGQTDSGLRDTASHRHIV